MKNEGINTGVSLSADLSDLCPIPRVLRACAGHATLRLGAAWSHSRVMLALLPANLDVSSLSRDADALALFNDIFGGAPVPAGPGRASEGGPSAAGAGKQEARGRGTMPDRSSSSNSAPSTRDAASLALDLQRQGQVRTGTNAGSNKETPSRKHWGQTSTGSVVRVDINGEGDTHQIAAGDDGVGDRGRGAGSGGDGNGQEHKDTETSTTAPSEESPSAARSESGRKEWGSLERDGAGWGARGEGWIFVAFACPLVLCVHICLCLACPFVAQCRQPVCTDSHGNMRAIAIVRALPACSSPPPVYNLDSTAFRLPQIFQENAGRAPNGLLANM